MRADDKPLKVWLLTDVFPPRSGGSGWSTYYLGKALAERGNHVRVLRPVYGEEVAGPKRRATEYGGLGVEELLVPAAPGWTDKLGLHIAWSERAAGRLMERRATALALRGEADVLHGQHAVSIMAASGAAKKARRQGSKVVSVGTVRDYWPLCPISTRLFTDNQGGIFECRECHRFRDYMKCACASDKGGLRARPFAAARWVRTMRASHQLAKCDAVIAVSDFVLGELARSGRVAPVKLRSIPNLLHLPSVEKALAGPWPLEDLLPGDAFLLFVGKWDANKGAQMLPGALARSGVRLPVVLAGDGPLRAQIEIDGARLGLDFRFYNWLGNDAILLLMKHAAALLFPSAWQEPLSRVLLEGCAAGTAIVALNTGGTANVIVHGTSGWLANSEEELAEGIRQVVGDAELNARLRAGARERAEEKFDAAKVSAQVEELYRSLLAERGGT
ncbi:MAG TPA: glycosyltransferase family 4 protein [Chloroflexia bacterium]|nr:glycosyltransferase family 4 protein [Chloroflexia bacterium]